MPLRKILYCGSTLKIVHMQLFLRLEGEYEKKTEQCFWTILGAMVFTNFELVCLAWMWTHFFILLWGSATNLFPLQI